MAPPTHPDFEVVKFVIKVVDGETTEVVANTDEPILFRIPESSKYTNTIHFKVKNNKLSDIKYKQAIKKAGITIKSRELDIGTYEPSEEIYTKEFPEDETPGGYFIRGVYPAHSTYFANDEQVHENEWSLEITKK